MSAFSSHYCPWCGVDHIGPTVLCAECEAEAQRFRAQSGLNVRRIPSIGSSPDD